jgi:hypothetical protein
MRSSNEYGQTNRKWIGYVNTKRTQRDRIYLQTDWKNKKSL